MKLGVISDTHGRLNETFKAIELFRSQGVTEIIHCGDIGGVDIIRAFEGIPTHFVLGNTDGENEFYRAVAEETGNVLHGWFGSIERNGKKVFFLHGHHNARFDKELNSGSWDLICYGHTHFASLQMENGTLLLNPGAFQRVATPCVAVVTLPELNVESFFVPFQFS